MTRRTLLIGAGGTATAWHLANLIADEFRPHVRLLLCDSNPRRLVAAATLAEGFFQVPLADAEGYRAHMLALFEAEGVDVFVPLVDQDCYGFPADDPDLARLGVTSTGVVAEAADILRDKSITSAFVEAAGLPVPTTHSAESILASPAEAFFVKPRCGFGSRGVYRTDRAGALEAASRPEWLVQDLCVGPEVTVEVFCEGDTVEALCRERLETKAGVCTKARLWADAELTELARRVCRALPMPVAFCFQVMRDHEGAWVITDLNPRLGAGTAMSTKVGWSLARAALHHWIGLPLDGRSCLVAPARERFVVRAYTEILTE